MKCFYNEADLNSKCCGAIIVYDDPGCEMIGVNHGDRLSREDIAAKELVYVVGFSFPAEDMVWLASRGELHWFDQDKMAIEECNIAIEEAKAVEGAELEIFGERNTNRASCLAVWGDVYGVFSRVPPAIHLLGWYCLDDPHHPVALHFQYGMESQRNTQPKADIWRQLFHGPLQSEQELLVRISDGGRVVLRYECKQREYYAKHNAFETSFEGIPAIAINGLGGSELLESVYNPEHHDIMVVFHFVPEKMGWKFSLFSHKKNIDCGELAGQKGGSGSVESAIFHIPLSDVHLQFGGIKPFSMVV